MSKNFSKTMKDIKPKFHVWKTSDRINVFYIYLDFLFRYLYLDILFNIWRINLDFLKEKNDFTLPLIKSVNILLFFRHMVIISLSEWIIAKGYVS